MAAQQAHLRFLQSSEAHMCLCVFIDIFYPEFNFAVVPSFSENVWAAFTFWKRRQFGSVVSLFHPLVVLLEHDVLFNKVISLLASCLPCFLGDWHEFLFSVALVHWCNPLVWRRGSSECYLSSRSQPEISIRRDHSLVEGLLSMLRAPQMWMKRALVQSAKILRQC